MRTIAGLLAAAGTLLAPVAAACPPRVVSYQQQQQTYVTPVAAYAVPLVVPLYSATYTPAPEPPPAAAPADDAAAAIRELSEAVRQLRAELAQMRGGLPPGAQAMPPAVPTEPPPLAMRRLACAACHSAPGAEQKGHGFVLYLADGSPRPLSDQEERKCVIKVASGDMPKTPAKPLNDAQRKMVVESFLLKK